MILRPDWKGVREDKYLKMNKWLKDVNNDVDDSRNMSRSERMATLNTYMASVGSDDQVVQPKESAWHTFWDWGDPFGDVIDPRETESYLGDYLGLKTLDEQGKLILNMYEGDHTAYNASWWHEVVKPLFNNSQGHTTTPNN